MDFEVIDSIHADCLGKGDIINEDGDFIQISSIIDSDIMAIEAHGYNLSTGDDWDNYLLASDRYDIYRSY